MRPGLRFQSQALLALQEAAEAHLVSVFEVNLRTIFVNFNQLFKFVMFVKITGLVSDDPSQQTCHPHAQDIVLIKRVLKI